MPTLCTCKSRQPLISPILRCPCDRTRVQPDNGPASELRECRQPRHCSHSSPPHPLSRSAVGLLILTCARPSTACLLVTSAASLETDLLLSRHKRTRGSTGQSTFQSTRHWSASKHAQCSGEIEKAEHDKEEDAEQHNQVTGTNAVAPTEHGGRMGTASRRARRTSWD